MSLSPVIDYWALLSSLNLGPAYRPRSQPWSLETHGSHIANGVELVPGAPGYQPQLAYNQWFSLLFSAPPLPLPTLSLASSAEGFALTLSVAGTVKMSVSGDLGSFVAGYTLLTAQATVKEGFLTLSANGQTSTATNQYVVLGTANDDSIDTSAAGTQHQFMQTTPLRPNLFQTNLPRRHCTLSSGSCRHLGVPHPGNFNLKPFILAPANKRCVPNPSVPPR